MKKKELRQRFSKNRKRSSPGAKRVKETTEKKASSLMSMISRAIDAGFSACYVLADSWFFNSQLVQFVLDNDLHLVSRPKWNQWKYVYKGNAYTLGELIKKLQRQKKYKTSRQLRMRTAEVHVTFQGYPIKLFFYKDKKRGSKWNALSLMVYNELSHQKAINDYESIGYLFAEVSQDWLKPNIIERFWSYLYELLLEISEAFNKDIQELINLVLKSNEFFTQFFNSFANMTTET